MRCEKRGKSNVMVVEGADDGICIGEKIFDVVLGVGSRAVWRAKRCMSVADQRGDARMREDSKLEKRGYTYDA